MCSTAAGAFELGDDRDLGAERARHLAHRLDVAAAADVARGEVVGALGDRELDVGAVLGRDRERDLRVGRLIPLRVETVPPWTTRAVTAVRALGDDLDLDQAVVDQHPLADPAGAAGIRDRRPAGRSRRPRQSRRRG